MAAAAAEAQYAGDADPYKKADEASGSDEEPDDVVWDTADLDGNDADARA